MNSKVLAMQTLKMYLQSLIQTYLMATSKLHQAVSAVTNYPLKTIERSSLSLRVVCFVKKSNQFIATMQDGNKDRTTFRPHPTTQSDSFGSS